jgi:hypothetical protein
MARSGVLRRVDGGALEMLCEDLAMLDTLRKGLAAQAREITQKGRGEAAADLRQCAHRAEPHYRGAPYVDHNSGTVGSDHHSAARIRIDT